MDLRCIPGDAESIAIERLLTLPAMEALTYQRMFGLRDQGRKMYWLSGIQVMTRMTIPTKKVARAA